MLTFDELVIRQIAHHAETDPTQIAAAGDLGILIEQTRRAFPRSADEIEIAAIIYQYGGIYPPIDGYWQVDDRRIRLGPEGSPDCDCDSPAHRDPIFGRLCPHRLAVLMALHTNQDPHRQIAQIFDDARRLQVDMLSVIAFDPAIQAAPGVKPIAVCAWRLYGMNRRSLDNWIGVYEHSLGEIAAAAGYARISRYAMPEIRSIEYGYQRKDSSNE